MIETEVMPILANYGFPVVITMWFMFRTEKVISKNTEAFEKINGVLERCQKR